MAKKPYKYRQARKDAKGAAKKAFPGKVKAARKDITGKITAEDRLALQDMADTAKKELGKKAFLDKKEYDIARKAEIEKFQQSMADEFGDYAGKKAGEAEKPVKKEIKVVDKRTPLEKKASKKAAAKEVKKNTKKFVQKGSKAVVDTPVKKGGPVEKALKAEKKMTRAERSAANKAAWKNMTPAERKNWSASKPGTTAKAAETKPTAKKPTVRTGNAGTTAKPKPGLMNDIKKSVAEQKAKEKAPKRPTLADLKRNEAKGLEEAKARVAAKNKALADSAKGKTQTPQAVEAKKKATAKPEGKPTVKKVTPKKFARTRTLGKGGVYGALAGEVVSLAKGSTKKDFNEINRLEAKLATLTGKDKSRATAGRQGAQQQLSQLASLASMGVVGKTRRQRMDELNNLIAKAETKKAKANKGLRYGKMGESLVPGTKAYKAGSKTRPTVATTGGGSTTTVNTNKYTVKKGDTFSGIAKTAGVSLKELRAANPEIMNKKKYKQGSMIWSGTKVNIPKK